MHHQYICSHSPKPAHAQERTDNPLIPRVNPIALSYMGKQTLHVYDSQLKAGIDLQVPMTLQPPVLIRIRIRSATQFFASTGDNPTNPEWKSITTEAPVNSLVLYSRLPVHLKPQYTLGPLFVRHWENLPEELRVMIITQNMIAYPVRQGCRYPMDLITKLFPHCRMTPHIARMATEAFYRNNEFLIQLNSGMPNRYPPAPLNCLIRRLHLTMYICRSHCTFLRKLSEGRLGFGSLRYLRIKISWHFPVRDSDNTDWDNFIDDTTDNPIEFLCGGSLAVISRPAGLIMYVHRLMRADPAKQAVIQDRIKFGKN
ncbi:uncharacterized protein N0V89_001418 [Didymosphaeria variabile]|uniref:Uncharacterized protein n=1 Tax=Didymosphaeria variabile TaxID=1932322 RepID=A0A9W8XX66_9PLEO|nr:uncharacterized protein N0V89_001418 [Didymosphaeria variabile]KAJ4360851.1 hypothetical protein N0V89_001418 [Didymosphaeria variabile]